jgi:topoisomerase-4 subunit B
MTSLFNTPPKPGAQASYTAQDIEVLEGLEPVRHRPGMYIGGTDDKALHHLAAEVLDNAMDEVVAGFAKTIYVSLDENYHLTIRDDGRGIPIDPHPKYPDQSALEVILTTLHSGGKFSSKVYSTSGGLHGVGISVVNALTVHIARDGSLWKQTFSRGVKTSPLEKIGKEKQTGTTLTFHPDPDIFGGQARFNPATLYKMAQAKAYLHKGVRIMWQCAPSLCAQTNVPTQTTFYYLKGIEDFLIENVTAQGASVAECIPFAGEAAFSNGQGRVEWSVLWPATHPEILEESNLTSFCNTIPTPLGGTHESGFKQAMVKSLKSYAERLNNKRAQAIIAEDISASCFCVLSVFIQQPQFQGQTKEKLVSTPATRLVESAIQDHFDHWFADHPGQAAELIDFIANFAQARLKRKQSKEIARSSATKRLRLPGKLTDCTSPIAELSEIFLVEGDSAGGSAKQARNRATQAVLPLKGKILNVATASLDKLIQNQEVSDLITALGCGRSKTCDINKLRYHKIIIMTDADVDGAHIASLLLTFFYNEMRPVIDAGHVYLAQPPLYRLSHHGKTLYARDDKEKDRLLKTAFGQATKVDISRFKGLGEMPVEQLRSTTMDPTKRTLLKVLIHNDTMQTPEGDFVSSLMGKSAEWRFKFIQENAAFTQEIDI